MASVLKTTVAFDSPYDSSTLATDPGDKTTVSDFITIQSLTNFTAMAGAITAAWSALGRLPFAFLETLWVPYILALAWAAVSVGISWDGLKRKNENKLDYGKFAAVLFIALLNSLALVSAVLGVSTLISTSGA